MISGLVLGVGSVLCMPGAAGAGQDTPDQESLGGAQAVSHLQLCWSFDCDSVPSGKP